VTGTDHRSCDSYRLLKMTNNLLTVVKMTATNQHVTFAKAERSSSTAMRPSRPK